MHVLIKVDPGVVLSGIAIELVNDQGQKCASIDLRNGGTMGPLKDSPDNPERIMLQLHPVE